MVRGIAAFFMSDAYALDRQSGPAFAVRRREEAMDAMTEAWLR